MNRALGLLASGALLTLVIESTRSAHPWPGIVLAAIFTAAAIGGFGWVDRRPTRVRRYLGVAYVAVMLVLGYAVFSVAGAGVGSTLLLMVLVSQSVILLPPAGAALVTLTVPLVHVGMGWGDGLRNGLGMLAAAVFTAVVTALLQREQRSRAELAQLNDQLRGYAAQSEQLATIQERNRLARDIHDGLGHHLTVVQMQIQAARAVLTVDPVRADSVLAKAQQQASDALAEVRRSVAELREPRSTPPLPVALEALAVQAEAAGLPTQLHVFGAVRPLTEDTEESLFRTAQEGLTNVRKHSRAAHAELVLDYLGAERVQLEVRDDGLGTTEDSGESRQAGFGIVGLRERAAKLNGKLELESTPGHGTTLRLVVPG